MVQYIGSPRQPKKENGFDTIYTHGRLNQFIIDAIKAPMISGLAKLKVLGELKHIPELLESFEQLRKLPPPHKNITRWKNTDILIDARDMVISQKLSPWPDFATIPIANFAIVVYDYDPYYQQRLDWLYWRMKAEGWTDNPASNLAVLEKLKAEFFTLENNPGRDKAFHFIWDMALRTYETKKGQELMDVVVPFLLQSAWEPREPRLPRPPCWREFEN